MKDWKGHALLGFGAAAVGIFFALLGFYLLEEKGSDYAFCICLALAVACMVVEFVMLIKSGHRLEEKRGEQYTSMTAVMLPGMDRDRVLNVFQSHGFCSIDGDILMKKTYWRLGTVSSYVCWLPVRCNSDEELSETLGSALDGVGAWERRDKKLEKSHGCLFLFLELEEDVVMANIPTIAMELMRSSFTRPFSKKKVKTAIVILIDKASGLGHFWSQPAGPNVYSHGCRLLRKYFS